MIRFLDADAMQTADQLLDAIKVVDGTSRFLSKSISYILFEKHFILSQNIIGLEADNFATMMGRVYFKLS